MFTRGRVDKQYTLESLPNDVRKYLTIVCHYGEKAQHEKLWGGKVKAIIEYGKECTNLAMARDWCMQYFKTKGKERLIHIDDNVVFSNREYVSKKIRLVDLSKYDDKVRCEKLKRMFEWMVFKLKQGYAMAGISHRPTNVRKPKSYDENCRLFAVWGIDLGKYDMIHQRFSDNRCKEDFHIQLAFLTNGLPTICNYDFAFDKKGGANARGGCSTYRNLEEINRCSILLKKTYPQYVTIHKKKSDNWSGLGGVNRIETIVHWKKAFNSNIK